MSPSLVSRLAVAISLVATTACGSGGGGADGGGAGTGDDSVTCGIAIELSGAATLDESLDDSRGCISTTTLGPYVAFSPADNDEIVAIELSISSLMAGQTATALPAALTLDHADETEFAPTGCSVNVSENSFEEMDEIGSSYRVGGMGSCTGPGVADTRSISVVGFFRFVATLSWTN